MALPQFIADTVAAWASLYGNSKLVATGVTYAHLAGLLVGGGTAVDADRQILRAFAGEGADRAACLARVLTVHRTVVVSLALVGVTGILLFLSDVETFVGSKTFWGKMVLVALLVANGRLLLRAETALLSDDTSRNWTRLKRASMLSLALWALTLLFGTLLRTAA